MKSVEFYLGRNNAKCVGYLHDDLTPFCESYKLRPALIVCPGGGYEHLSPREADPVALKFFSHGINTFILYYSVNEAILDEMPLRELALAVDYIKKHSADLLVDKDRVAVMGFSAGAHLAASLAVYHSYPLFSHLDSRPSLAVLGYPVITSGEYANRKSFEKLSPSDPYSDFYSLEKHVREDTVPCFIFHTADDKSVPVENSLLFASALARNKVPFSLHIYEKGIHGISVCTNEVGTPSQDVESWLELCLKWMFSRWSFSE